MKGVNEHCPIFRIEEEFFFLLNEMDIILVEWVVILNG